MPDLNKANRQVCDVDVRELKTKKPFMFIDTANTTTAGLTGDAVYAMKKGTRAIAFQNPIEGTMTIELQVYPFKIFGLLSDGTIDTVATIAKKEDVVCGTAGTLTIAGAVEGSVFVYNKGSFGGTPIAGTYSSPTFTATDSANIEVGTTYEVAYLITKSSGIQKVSFNNKKVPKDFYITMSTLDKDEDGVLTPFIMTAYKASVHRDFELSFSSEGDPATVTLTFDLMEDKDGNVLDIVEDTSDSDQMSVSITRVSLEAGGIAPDIQIYGASGTVSAVASNASISALISGDYDSVIISADAGASAGSYTVTLTDDANNTAIIGVIVTE